MVHDEIRGHVRVCPLGNIQRRETTRTGEARCCDFCETAHVLVGFDTDGVDSSRTGGEE